MVAEKTLNEIRAALYEGRLDDAGAIIEREYNSFSDSPKLRYYQGVLLLKRNNQQEAIATLNEALGLATSAGDFKIALAASAYLAIQKNYDIKVRFTRADLYLAMGLTKAAYEYLLGELEFYRALNQVNLIFPVIKKIISIDEENLDLTLNMAKILNHLGKKAEVRRVVESAIFTLQGRGKYDEAAKIQKEYSKLYEEE